MSDDSIVFPNAGKPTIRSNDQFVQPSGAQKVSKKSDKRKKTDSFGSFPTEGEPTKIKPPTNEQIINEIKRINEYEKLELIQDLIIQRIKHFESGIGILKQNPGNIDHEEVKLRVAVGTKTIERLRKLSEINNDDDIEKLLQSFIEEDKARIEELRTLLQDPNKEFAETENYRLEISVIKARSLPVFEDLLDIKAITPELLGKRAYYNLTNDPNSFNEFLPYRNSIIDDPEKLKNYDNLVKLILKRGQFNFTDKDINYDNYRKEIEKLELKPTDSSLSYLMACTIVELFHNRPDLIQKELNSHNGVFTFTVVDEIVASQIYSGFYDRAASRIVVELNSAQEIDTMVHEFTHAVDDPDGSGCDGLLPGMSSLQEGSFIEEREGLFQRHHDFKGLLTDEISEFYNLDVRDYAFSNHLEFLPTTMELFISKPADLMETSPQLYELYRSYFLYDPLTKKDISGECVEENIEEEKPEPGFWESLWNSMKVWNGLGIK